MSGVITDLISELENLMPSALPEDGEVTDDNFNKIVTSIQKLFDLAKHLKEWDCPRVGGKYWRFPGVTIGANHLATDPTPDEIWPDTAWEEISTYYGGSFFRVVGGNARAFGSGVQLDAFERHQHQTTIQAGDVGNISQSVARGNNPHWGTDFYTTDAIKPYTPGVVPKDDIETRPVNLSIQVFRRLA